MDLARAVTGEGSQEAMGVAALTGQAGLHQATLVVQEGSCAPVSGGGTQRSVGRGLWGELPGQAGLLLRPLLPLGSPAPAPAHTQLFNFALARNNRALCIYYRCGEIGPPRQRGTFRGLTKLAAIDALPLSIQRV